MFIILTSAIEHKMHTLIYQSEWFGVFVSQWFEGHVEIRLLIFYSFWPFLWSILFLAWHYKPRHLYRSFIQRNWTVLFTNTLQLMQIFAFRGILGTWICPEHEFSCTLVHFGYYSQTLYFLFFNCTIIHFYYFRTCLFDFALK